MVAIPMLTDIKAKKKGTKARNKLACLLGRFNNNKTLSTMACKPKIRIIVDAMGLDDIKLVMLFI